ncbi:hypothetical protein V5F53_05700 [Xanthobacter sp. V4C-4]|uniref:DUF6867 family protein n=1 Tax=Xanthobacter cornucopiae TaxID=3119924 RepID=UPI00372C4B97
MARNPGRPTSPLLLGPLGLLVVFVLAVMLWPGEVIGPSLGDFLLVSLVLGGGAAWLTGRAVARGWGSLLHLAAYCVPLAAAVRFCHFALFDDALFAPVTSAAEILFLLAVAALGFRSVRKRQMIARYSWLFVPAGPLAWRRRNDGTDAEPPGTRL